MMSLQDNDQNLSMSLTRHIPGLYSAGYSSWSLSGVQANVQNNMLHFLKTSTTSRRSWSQWAGAGWALPSLNIGQGFSLAYRVRWNVLNGAGELKMKLPSLATVSNDESLLLRFKNGEVKWAVYDARTKSFTHQSSSTITANGRWHDILIHISPDALYIYEDGRNILGRTRSGTVSGSFDIVCELEEVEAFDAHLMGFKICPEDFLVGSGLLSTPTELLFNPASQELNRQYFSVQRFDSPIAVTYTENSLRFSTPSLTQKNYTVEARYFSALPTYSVVQYLFRINTSGGYESKITVAGDLILRVYHGNPQWQWFDSSGFKTLSSFTNFRVGGPYVSVLVIVSPGLLTVFENGKFNFGFERKPPSTAANTWAMFNVQHHDLNTAMDVELSHLRIVSGA